MGGRRLAILAGLAAAGAAFGARFVRNGSDDTRAGDPVEDPMPEEEFLHEGHPHAGSGEDRGHS